MAVPGFITVVAKSTGDAETPAWYDPYDSHDQIKIVFPDGTTKTVKLSSIPHSQVKQLYKDKQRSKIDENLFDRRLKQLFDDNSFELVEEPKENKINNLENKMPVVENPSKNIPVPKCKVIFSLNGIKLAAYYHDIIVEKPYIIFVYDTRAEGFPTASFDERAAVEVIIDDEVYKVQPICLKFNYKNYQFNVVLCLSEQAEEN